jgi:2-C-methyl-D-erythritol 4-phosphate cytidylyltransferase
MIAALIVAAGQGVRMGSARRKQYLNLGGLPMLARTLQVFDHCRLIDQIVIAVPPSEIQYCRNTVVAAAGPEKPVALIPGGGRRQDSVFNGLQYLGDQEGVVLIHDGVRPLVTPDLIEACARGAVQWGACIPAVTAVDTPKQINSLLGVIDQTLPRESICMAQTPQAFYLPLIRRAHAEARRTHREATDDASLVEALGTAVHIIPGLRRNIKITTAEDLAYAETLLKIGSDRPS